MRSVAILGAGAGGAAAAADVALRGYAVHLWNRSPATLEPYRRSGEVRYEGLLGSGAVTPEVITADLPEALADADAAVVCLPALAHEEVAAALAAMRASLPVVLHPGHTCGALHFRQVFRAAGVPPPPLAELSTLAYVARVYEPGTVTVTGVAERLRGACLPGGDDALTAALELYPVSRTEPDVLATGLANVNLVLHPPGAVLAAAWVEATGGDFLFYAEAVTPGVARVIAALDAERLAIARAYGHELEPLHDEMAAIGTADRAAAARGDLAQAIAFGAANRGIRAPDSLAHRYYAEDFGYGVVPLLALADAAAVPAPVATALLQVAETLLGRDLGTGGLGASRLGLEGLDRDGVLDLVRRKVAA